MDNNKLDELKRELNTKEITVFLKYDDVEKFINGVKKINELFASVDTNKCFLNKLIPNLKSDEEYIFYSYDIVKNKKIIEIVFYTQDDALEYIYKTLIKSLKANKCYYFLYQPHEGIFETNDIKGNIIKYNKIARLSDSCSFDSCMPMSEDMLLSLDSIYEIYDIYCYDNKGARRSIDEIRKEL